MRIGLVRHFKVICDREDYMTSSEYAEWNNNYNNSDVIVMDVDIDYGNWDICYSSNMKRAVQTAQHIYKGEITQLDTIKEVPIAPIISTEKKRSYKFWMITGRIAWMLSHKSQPERRKETALRAQDFVRKLLSDDKNKLVVTHGYLMRLIRKELIRHGFKGERFQTPENGRIYIFER